MVTAGSNKHLLYDHDDQPVTHPVIGKNFAHLSRLTQLKYLNRDVTLFGKKKERMREVTAVILCFYSLPQVFVERGYYKIGTTNTENVHGICHWTHPNYKVTGLLTLLLPTVAKISGSPSLLL